MSLKSFTTRLTGRTTALEIESSVVFGTFNHLPNDQALCQMSLLMGANPISRV
ncbi:MAG: hypothetical protein L7U83_14790 [Akkermansiaceae bacterium]|nr:hypothetical protein [Akkermansiaceae bacterium]